MNLPSPFFIGHICSDISHELIHHKIIPVPFRQPSTVFQPTGAAGEADHVESGSVPSSLTCKRPTLASTRRGFAHKIVPNGVQLWRRLCSPLGVPPDDDDDSSSRLSTLTRDTDSNSVCPSVRHVPVLYRNGLTYRHKFFTAR